MGVRFNHLIFVLFLVSLIALAGCKSGPRGAYESCSSNTICFSQSCVGGYCAPSEVGQPCALNQDCSSQLCKDNVCVKKAWYCSSFNVSSVCVFLAVIMLVFLLTDLLWGFHPLALVGIPVDGKNFGVYIIVMIVLFMLGLFLPSCF